MGVTPRWTSLPSRVVVVNVPCLFMLQNSSFQARVAIGHLAHELFRLPNRTILLVIDAKDLLFTKNFIFL